MWWEVGDLGKLGNVLSAPLPFFSFICSHRPKFGIHHSIISAQFGFFFSFWFVLFF